MVARSHVCTCVRGSPIAWVDRQHLHGMTATFTLRVLGFVEALRRLADVGDEYAVVAWYIASIADGFKLILGL